MECNESLHRFFAVNYKHSFLSALLPIPSSKRYLATVRLEIEISCPFKSFTIVWSLKGVDLFSLSISSLITNLILDFESKSPVSEADVTEVENLYKGLNFQGIVYIFL